MAKKSRVIHFAVEPSTERELQALAKKADLPLSVILRTAVKSYLAAMAVVKAEVKNEAA